MQKYAYTIEMCMDDNLNPLLPHHASILTIRILKHLRLTTIAATCLLSNEFQIVSKTLQSPEGFVAPFQHEDVWRLGRLTPLSQFLSSY